MKWKAADRNSWTRVASCARIFCGYGCILISSSIWETPSGDVSKRPVHSHSEKIKKDFHPDMYLWRLRNYTIDTCMLKSNRVFEKQSSARSITAGEKENCRVAVRLGYCRPSLRFHRISSSAMSMQTIGKCRGKIIYQKFRRQFALTKKFASIPYTCSIVRTSLAS